MFLEYVFEVHSGIVVVFQRTTMVFLPSGHRYALMVEEGDNS
jgi:hypothetical protein